MKRRMGWLVAIIALTTLWAIDHIYQVERTLTYYERELEYMQQAKDRKLQLKRLCQISTSQYHVLINEAPHVRTPWPEEIDNICN